MNNYAEHTVAIYSAIQSLSEALRQKRYDDADVLRKYIARHAEALGPVIEALWKK